MRPHNYAIQSKGKAIRRLVAFILLARASLDIVFAELPFTVGGLNLTAGAVSNVVIIFIAGTLALSRSSAPALPFLLWMPFLGITTLSVLWSPILTESFRAALVLFSYFAAFAIPFFLRLDKHNSLMLLKSCVYSSLVPAAYAMFELVSTASSGEEMRIKSTFLHPNVFAFYLNIIVGIIFYLLYSKTIYTKKWPRAPIFGYSTILTALLIPTQARSAWAAAMLLLIAYVTIIDKRLLVVLFLLPALLFVPTVSSRLNDLGRGTEFSGRLDADGIDSYEWRKLMWKSALDDASETPLFGKGLASFGPNALRFFPLVEQGVDYTSKGIGAHNTYIQIYYETGLLGVVGYVGLLLGVLLQTAKNFRNDRKGCVVVLVVILGYMAENYSDNILEYGALNLYFYMFLGLVISGRRES